MISNDDGIVQTFKITQGGIGVDAGFVSKSNPLHVSVPLSSKSTVRVVESSPFSSVLLTASTIRTSAIITNETDGDLLLLFSTGTASISNYSLKLNSGNILKLSNNDYCGVINCISTGIGLIRITEVTWK